MTYAYFIATQTSDIQALSDTLDLGYWDMHIESMEPPAERLPFRTDTWTHRLDVENDARISA